MQDELYGMVSSVFLNSSTRYMNRYYPLKLICEVCYLIYGYY